jgi:hypothetical protein
MKCTRVEKFLPLHVAGDLTGRRGRAVTIHLATCERCRHAADQYDATRNLLRAVTLPPDFDRAFYEDIRNSVLVQLRRNHTPAPPASAKFSTLFNVRLAYAASLALLILAAALILHSYLHLTTGNDARQRILANENRESNLMPQATATPKTTQVGNQERQPLYVKDEFVRGTTNREISIVKSPRWKRAANNERAQNGVRQVEMLTKHMPSLTRRNPLAPTAAPLRQAGAEEIASAGSETLAQPEVSRIEIQTSDPNIRIIWLSPKADAVAQPLK